MSGHSEHFVNDSAYLIFTIAAESVMWFWSVVNIMHYIARVDFAEMKLCIIFSPDGFDYGHQNISVPSLLNHVFVRC